MARQMIYCERRGTITKAQADPRSFRWKQSGRARILLACPRGAWNNRAERCETGIRAYKILTPAKRGRCKAGAKKIRK